jgi:hypothetical protein
MEPFGVDAYGVVVDHLDALDDTPQGGSAGSDRVGRHGAFEAELDVVGGDGITIMPLSIRKKCEVRSEK